MQPCEALRPTDQKVDNKYVYCADVIMQIYLWCGVRLPGNRDSPCVLDRDVGLSRSLEPVNDG